MEPITAFFSLLVLFLVLAAMHIALLRTVEQLRKRIECEEEGRRFDCTNLVDAKRAHQNRIERLDARVRGLEVQAETHGTMLARVMQDNQKFNGLLTRQTQKVAGLADVLNLTWKDEKAKSGWIAKPITTNPTSE